MRYKFRFKQDIEGNETCDAVIVADSMDEALDKLKARDFTMYIVQSNDHVVNGIYDVEALGEID